MPRVRISIFMFCPNESLADKRICPNRKSPAFGCQIGSKYLLAVRRPDRLLDFWFAPPDNLIMNADYSKIPSPAYVLDIGKLERNLRAIDDIAGQADVTIIPALKGFAMWKAFSFLKPYVRGAAASGLYESRLIREELNVYAHTYSPAFINKDFDEILSYSSHVTFNSLYQHSLFSRNIRAVNNAGERHISGGLRVNPGFSPVSTLLYNPAAPGSRLGVGKKELALSGLPDDIEGLHFHVLCESEAKDSVNAVDAFEKQFKTYLEGGRIKWVNFGGGHLMTAEGYDPAVLVNRLIAFRDKYPGIEVFLEPGSAFVWDTGVLRSTVVDIVERDGISTAVLDVSFTAHMPDCLEMPYQPRILGAEIAEQGNDEASTDGYRYRVGGNSCLAGDWAGDWIFPRPLKPGDDVVFLDMIHYTMVKTTMFNGVKHPDIGIYDDGTYRLLREFSYEDYKSRLS